MAANIIAELMYAQCDVDGNEYLLLEAFVNHRKWFSNQCREPNESCQMVRNPEKVKSWLGHLLHVERWLHVMGEVIPP